jgi:predicted nuclease of restriction endonuclease-like (RecB) superfamily
MKLNKTTATDFISDVKLILERAQQKAYTAVNYAMIEGYWLTGKRIIEEEQLGEKRAPYGKKIIENLSAALSGEFEKKYSERSLREFRQFYVTFPDLLSNQRTASAESEIWRTSFAKLHWSHYQRVLKVADANARMYYLKEAANNNWNIKTLDRNISTRYYHRLLSSQIKEPVEKEMQEKTQAFQNDSFEFIKNPSVLEFLNLPVNTGYTEAELEKALIHNLQKFLLELGKGYAFVERQQLIRTDTADFYIDLVFYNYILKCFVIIELKTNKLTHQDIGQLDMYVRMYDDLKKQETDNPTIGILLCTETDSTIAKYSVLNQNQQLFATKYMEYLPTEAELIAEIEREKLIIKQQLGYEGKL